MSTKAIRSIISKLGEPMIGPERERLVRDALAEVVAIEKASRVLHSEDLFGMMYDVRDRAAGDAAFTGNTWDHPRVVAVGEAASVVERIAKESGK